jgi:hypothetical protein
MWNIQKIVSSGNYDFAIVPEHPKRYKFDYVPLHRVVMENYLGRILEDNEIVHHIKEDEKKNNDIENLELCLVDVHSRYHTSQKGKEMVDFICPVCEKLFTREKYQTYLVKKNGRFACCSRSCGSKLAHMDMDNIEQIIIRSYKI